MTQKLTIDQLLKAIESLARVVEVNKGLSGSESTQRIANQKIKEYISQLP